MVNDPDGRNCEERNPSDAACGLPSNELSLIPPERKNLAVNWAGDTGPRALDRSARLHSEQHALASLEHSKLDQQGLLPVWENAEPLKRVDSVEAARRIIDRERDVIRLG